MKLILGLLLRNIIKPEFEGGNELLVNEGLRRTRQDCKIDDSSQLHNEYLNIEE